MRFKTRTQKNKMGKSNTANSVTSWVPSDFKQKDLEKAHADGSSPTTIRSPFLALSASPSPRAASG
jgi:hypothetical protein